MKKMYSELEKYELINNSETIEELQKAILKIADENGNIRGRIRYWEAKKQAESVSLVVNKQIFPNVLTRSYGIRQQALYLRYYKDIINV